MTDKNTNVHCEDDEHDNYKSAFVNVVSVDVDLYAKKYAVKKTLSIPKVFQNALLKELNT